MPHQDANLKCTMESASVSFGKIEVEAANLSDPTCFKNTLGSSLQALTQLNLPKLNISELPAALCDINGLQVLNVSQNILKCLPPKIGQFKCIRKLFLSFNKLSDLPTSFAELDVLEVIDLSHNDFESLPDCFEVGCGKICEFNISHNRLQEWEKTPLCAPGLKVLSVSNNHLRINPAWIWSDICTSMVELDLSYNALIKPSYVSQTNTIMRTGINVGLKSLNLCNSGLNSDNIHLLHQLQALRNLNIGNRRKEEICVTNRKFISNFIWNVNFTPFQSSCVLTELRLNGVGLSSVPEDIFILENLEVFDCQENELQWLPDTLSKLSRLRMAIFSNNKLLYLPKDFGDLTALEELWLDSNQLEDLPSSFGMLKNLKWLDLYSNFFENIPSCIEGLLDDFLGFDIDYNLFESKTVVNEIAGSNLNLYETLKRALYKHSCACVKVCRWMSRYKGVRDKESEYEDESSRSVTSSDYESENGSVVGDFRESAETENVVLEEENWDLDDGVDDYYDPTCPLSRPEISMNLPARALILHEAVLGPDSFCPSDIHPSPSVRARKDPLMSSEGQFEDA